MQKYGMPSDYRKVKDEFSKSSLGFVGESGRSGAWFGHAAECGLAHESGELLGDGVVSVLDRQVKRRLALVVLAAHLRSTSATSHLPTALAGKVMPSAVSACLVPPSFVCLGARDFSVSCAVVWNSLPADLQVFLSVTAATFAKHLKTYSFLAWLSASEDNLFCTI